MSKIFTIGYTSYDIENFIKVLKKNNINLLIDVRSSPYSTVHKDYDKENLENILSKHGIIYRNYSKEFGARQNNSVYFSNGILDFVKFSKSPKFIDGIKRIKNGIKHNKTICLMCAEKDPIYCHRTIMISRFLKEYGFDIIHLLENDNSITQNDLENKLVEQYTNIFNSEQSKEDILRFAYNEQNKIIGYRLEDDDE